MFTYDKDECTMKIEDYRAFVKENPIFTVKTFKYSKITGKTVSYKEHKININNIKYTYSSGSKGIDIYYKNGKVKEFSTTEVFDYIYDECKNLGEKVENYYFYDDKEFYPDKEAVSIFDFRFLSMDDFNKIRFLSELYDIDRH